MEVMFNLRLQQLQSRIVKPILIKKKENLFYLTGRSFDLRAEEYLLVKPINTDQARRNTDVVGFGSGLEQMDWIKTTDRLKHIGEYLKGFKHLDIEYGFTYGEGKYLRFKLKNQKSKIKIKPERSMVDEMRQIKEIDELAKIRKSMQIVEKVFELLKKKLAHRSLGEGGWTEIKLAQFIQSAGLKMGAHDVSFPAIVASGANASVPHHVPSNKKLKVGESIIIDFGFKYKNYCSDFTRTVFLKSVPKKLETAYNQVEKAYEECIKLCNHPSPTLPLKGREKAKHLPFEEGAKKSPPSFPKRGIGGVSARDVYQHSVNILSEKKLDKYFIHSLGHGTGLEIHELPNLSPRSKDVITNNMVFSIEPGVYLPKVGGIRIEDLVFMENGKCKKFINISTKLRDNVL